MKEIKEKPHYEKINPFTGIWIRTRETVRYVIEEKKIGYVLLLVILSGIINALVGALDPQVSAEMPLWATILIGLVLGPISGIAGVAFLSAVYLLFGKIFKGTSSYSDMFKAIGTTSIPYIWFAPVLLISYLAAPDVMMIESSADISPVSFIVGGLVAILSIGLAIWSLIIQSKAIGEAHRFSSWKGFFTLLIPGVIGLVLLIVVVMLFAITFMNFS